VQQIADASGYSKTGLLHRFPSKEALRAAVTEHFVAELDTIVAAVRELPVGADRDLAVIRALADLSLRRRGTIALMVSGLTTRESSADLAWMHGVADALFSAFGLAGPAVGPGGPADTACTADLDRCIRIYGALGALGVTALAAADTPGELIRDPLVATAFDALGHRTPAGPADRLPSAG
jgi:AcrR family transcriptional regulator